MLRHSLAEHGHRRSKGIGCLLLKTRRQVAYESRVVSPVGVRPLSGWVTHSPGAHRILPVRSAITATQEGHATPSRADVTPIFLDTRALAPGKERKTSEQTDPAVGPSTLASRVTVCTWLRRKKGMELETKSYQ